MHNQLWTASEERQKQANLSHFIEFSKKTAPINDYDQLYLWSIAQPEQFWANVWDFCKIKSSQSYSQVLTDKNNMLSAKWFVGAKLNFAENLLQHAERLSKKNAIVFWGEDKVKRHMTYGELLSRVTSLARYLKISGVGVGDRVAGFIPNMPEAIVAMLATASLGAVWSSCSPDFGFKGILDRFSQIEPKILFCADAYYFKGQTIDCLERAQQIAQSIPSIKKVIVVPYVDKKPDISLINNSYYFSETCSALCKDTLDYQQLDFNHPLYILYSSGTTGLPKCIVHGAGGTLIQHLKELVLHTDLKEEDNIFYFSTCGWMMWNWLVSSLAVGATVMLYDGNPFYPKADQLFNFIDQEKISIFGTSAKYIAALDKAKIEPQKTHKLEKLKTILSTGSPLLPESFDYVYSKIKKDLCLSSISGGTDIISCFALGNPIAPVYRGELQTRGLGMNVDIFDENGKTIIQQKGELVCKSPFPSMPIYFWNDPENKKYKAAYFEKYNNTWCHGDYAELTENNGLIIYGRSDTVLNPGGVRIGTAEIYRIVEQIPQIAESLVVGQDWQEDVRVILFVKLQMGYKLNQNLIEEIKNKIKTQASPRHVPAKVIEVNDIPRTISGKIVELAVRNIINGMEAKNLNIDALANPQALEQFRNLQDLKT